MPTTDDPHKVGQLLICAWGESKTVRNRVFQVTHVEKLGTSPFYYYRYNVRTSTGEIEINTGKYLITFEEYQKGLHRRLERTYQSVSKQEKAIIAVDKLEEEAKKVFKVDSKEEHCVTPQV